LPNLCKLAKHRAASHVGESGDFGDCGEYGKILPNCQSNLVILANVAKFCQIAKLMQIS